MLKLLSLREWWLQHLSRLSESNLVPTQTAADLLTLCKTSGCPFGGAGGAGVVIPRSVAAPFRDAQAEKERAVESIARLPLEYARAQAYWGEYVQLLEYGIDQRERHARELLGEARPWLPMLLACGGREEGLAPDVAASLAARGAEVSALLGQAHLLRQSLRLGRAQVAVGKAMLHRMTQTGAAVAASAPGAELESDVDDVDAEECVSDDEAEKEHEEMLQQPTVLVDVDDREAGGPS